MYIILSQRKDIEMSYSDSLYKLYHFPVRYKNQIHEGDTFVYYQGDRTNKDHRIYFGTGTIGKIHSTDGVSFYAELINCQSFEKEISIYLDNDIKYIESFGYDTIRKSPTPPWQSSIRPLSEQAYKYIIAHAGILTNMESANPNSDVDELLKQAIKRYYLEGDVEGLKEAYNIIGDILGFSSSGSDNYSLPELNEARQLVDYCKSMRMSFSYKAVLILALIDTPKLSISISEAVTFFRDFYSDRKNNNKKVEKQNCMYNRNDLTDGEIADNIIRNPINALLKSGYFVFDEENNLFMVKQEIVPLLTQDEREEIRNTCNQRLAAYYSSLGK